MGARDTLAAVGLTARSQNANGQLYELAQEWYGSEDAPLKVLAFLCECGQTKCSARVEFGLADYAALRERDGYVLAPGHRVTQAERARRKARELRNDAAALRAEAGQQQKRARRLKPDSRE